MQHNLKSRLPKRRSTYTRQLRIESSQGEPRESPKFCEKKTGDEADRLTKASACRAGGGRDTNPATGTQTNLATRRGRAARFAIANGQSADGIVDEKSGEKLPARTGAVEGRNGANPEWGR